MNSFNFHTPSDHKEEFQFKNKIRIEKISIGCENNFVEGVLSIPRSSEVSRNLIIFAHGSGSSRFSDRNIFISEKLLSLGFSTLLFNMLTEQETRLDRITNEFQNNVPYFSKRLVAATEFVGKDPSFSNYFTRIFFFGSSVGGCAAIHSAVQLSSMKPTITGILARGSNLTLCDQKSIDSLSIPIMLIVGELDKEMVKINEHYYRKLFINCPNKQYRVIPNATHLFPEPQALEELSNFTCDYFQSFFK
ncbi:hypothetical protein DLAC_05066 [Tieghemostelium lacteum]|uniref:Dienelactone hydrolase domain-containing protein n=1 Tax=Tieghemostelium lacteum TaxID=361077 RepID=A0A151ZI54_TIELA|nr:hypothetical protein DLAC_05066 [Tieghemostelium lacteum]|eukprot:KYQ93678.1 hypothetical protein DLAC_05066 [Tieghemostelium lacteum]